MKINFHIHQIFEYLNSYFFTYFYYFFRVFILNKVEFVIIFFFFLYAVSKTLTLLHQLYQNFYLFVYCRANFEIT